MLVGQLLIATFVGISCGALTVAGGYGLVLGLLVWSMTGSLTLVGLAALIYARSEP